MAMADQEENHTHKSSNNNSRSCKKMKAKKIPQRGLGVAQLEKIRLEEQHRKEAFASSSSSSSLISSFLPQHLSQITTLPSPPPPVPSFVHRGAEARAPNPYSDDHHHHQHGQIVPQNLNVVGELRTRNSPPQCVLQRSQHCQHLSSSSMVKVSAGISSSSSSTELNFQMEPPSNQNYWGKIYTPRWPEEEVKMVGIKRQCPFSTEYPTSLATFTCKYAAPPGYTPPISRTYESSSLPTREGLSNSDSLSASIIPRRLRRDGEAFDGDFLTLAPPMASSPHFHHRGGEEELGQPATSGSDQPLIHGFRPLAEPQVGQEAAGNECKGEVSGGVDLSLRL